MAGLTLRRGGKSLPGSSPKARPRRLRT